MTIRDYLLPITTGVIGAGLGLVLMNRFAPEKYETLVEKVQCETTNILHTHHWECRSPLSEKLNEELKVEVIPYIQANSTYDETFFIVSGQRQRLYLATYSKEGDLTITGQAPVSTAKDGFGNNYDSEKTPLGLHQIAEIYGTDKEEGQMFINWEFTKQKGKIYTSENPAPQNTKGVVMAPVLRLKGLKQENQWTYKRNIYFHTTNRVDELGKKASHACIRLKYLDAITLAKYYAKQHKTLVYISQY
ncbi:MAG: L,D-transpeptidase [Candidatus Woesearchaeota archaeon]|jgi:hypothetical protein